jgi:hypothetical protein
MSRKILGMGQSKVEGKEEAQALVFLSPAWAARVVRQGRERASFPPARRAAPVTYSVLWTSPDLSATLSPQGEREEMGPSVVKEKPRETSVAQ